jgi:hypothetical protein
MQPRRGALPRDVDHSALAKQAAQPICQNAGAESTGRTQKPPCKPASRHAKTGYDRMGRHRDDQIGAYCQYPQKRGPRAVGADELQQSVSREAVPEYDDRKGENRDENRQKQKKAHRIFPC